MTGLPGALKPRRRRLIGNAIKVSALLILISVLLIVLIGRILDQQPEWLAIALAIFGAVLQTAVLGLIYEVWLRSDVEDATLEKLGTSRDVREHGLVSLKSEAQIDWAELLSSARKISIVSHDPRGLFGRADDAVLRRAGEGGFRKLAIAVPAANWDEVLPWLQEFAERWKKSCGASAEFFGIRLESEAKYELVATDTRSIVLLPALDAAPAIPAVKLMEFKTAADAGIGAWLHRQFDHIQGLNAEVGYSPPKPSQRRQKPAQQVESQSAPEELA